MPLPPALLARLKNRGIVASKPQESKQKSSAAKKDGKSTSFSSQTSTGGTILIIKLEQALVTSVAFQKLFRCTFAGG